jgi:hypothetical protein
MGNVKVSISLAEHVYRLAQKKSRLVHGNNFSNYINSLICKDFTEAELERELNEVTKPIFAGKTKEAEFDSTCKHCSGTIKTGTVICLAGFEDGTQDWVHRDCCRRE